MSRNVLYYELKGIENIIRNIEESYRKFKEVIESEANPDKFQFLKAPTKIDTEVIRQRQIIQRQIIENYKTNPILRDALNGYQSIEDTVLELDDDMKGIRRFLPRFKNKTYNGRVDLLRELIPDADYLKRRGILSFDNFIGCGIYMTAIFYGLSIVFVSLITISTDPNPASSEQILYPFKEIASPIVGVLVGGINQVAERGKNNIIKNAQYIDSKIKEFYAQSS